MIDLKDFVDGCTKVEVVLSDKKWIFREPSINELLKITQNDDIEKIVSGLILEGDIKELDQELNNLTAGTRQAFMAKLLSDLGLVSKAVVSEIENTTIK